MIQNSIVQTLSEGADASEDGTGRGTPLVWPIQEVSDQDVMYTLQSGHQHGVASPIFVRRLTPLECERLQAFPDGWSCLCGATEAMLAEQGISSDAWRGSDWRSLRLAGHTARCRCPGGPRYRALGNAVTVTVAEWIGLALLRAMGRCA